MRDSIVSDVMTGVIIAVVLALILGAVVESRRIGRGRVSRRRKGARGRRAERANEPLGAGRGGGGETIPKGAAERRAGEKTMAGVQLGTRRAAVEAILSRGLATNQGVIVRAAALAALLDIPERKRLTPVQSRRLMELIEEAGLAVEPDPRRTGRGLAWDEEVHAFAVVPRENCDEGRLIAAEVLLRGVLAARDGAGGPGRHHHASSLQKLAGALRLRAAERVHLDALHAVLSRISGDGILPGGAVLRELSEEARDAMVRLLVEVAWEDGRVTSTEDRALRKVFRRFGLAPEAVDAVVAGLERPDEIRHRAGPVELDPMQIAQIMTETRHVSKLLADAMAPDEELDQGEEQSPVPTPAPADTGDSDASVGLHVRYAPFFAELRARADWSRADADALARAHGLMLSGAIEAINEWAVERRGHPVIEEDGDHVRTPCA